MTAIPMPAAPQLAPAGGMPLPASSEVGIETPSIIEETLGRIAGSAVRMDAEVRVLIVEELDQVVERVRELLREDAQLQLVETVREGRRAIERIADVRPDVVIIDTLLQGETSGLRVARQLRESGVATPIVFLTVPDMPVTLTSEMGLAAVMTLPLDGRALREVVRRLDEDHRGPVAHPPSGTIAVFSAKGGVGRTTIAHNLAVALDAMPGTRAVLVDGDLVHGDLRLHLGAPDDAPSLLGLPTGHVGETDLAPLLWRDPAGVDVLLAPPRMEQADLVMLSDVTNALRILRRLYDVVVVDVPAVMDDTTLAILDGADVVLDVVTTERAAVQKAQRCHAVLEAAAFPLDKLVTIVNRAETHGSSEGAFASELGRRPEMWLPPDRRVAEDGLAAGSAIVAEHPEAPLSRALADLATLVAARVGSPAAPVAALAA
jgi:pilus assembly protein CpaE